MPSTRRQLSSVLVQVALLGSILPSVHAQTTNATCLPAFQWMSNSRGQSPCLVTAYLNTPCLSNPADSEVFSLPPGFHYRPPTPASATACQCNSVFYSVIQACAVCQGDPTTPWSTWNMNCTAAIYESVFPEPIPTGTSIPAWAYLDVSFSDNFNASAAQINANEGHPESVAAGPSSTISGPTASASGSSNGPSGPVAGGTPSSSHSNTGAIVGGVVGGIGGAAILATVLFWYWRRQRRNVGARNTTLNSDPNAFAPGVALSNEKPGENVGAFQGPTLAYSNVNLASNMSMSTSPPPGMNTAGVGAGYGMPSSPTAPTGKIYDPNDPSTFPMAGLEPSLHIATSATLPSTSTPPILYPSNQIQYQQQHMSPQGGQYHGAPEV